jgi:hypothetical protein
VIGHRVARSLAMKAAWARRKAARVEPEVREEPRSEPVRLEWVPCTVEAVVAHLQTVRPMCVRCGHGLGVHDYRGCQAGACRCGSFR